MPVAGVIILGQGVSDRLLNLRIGDRHSFALGYRLQS